MPWQVKQWILWNSELTVCFCQIPGPWSLSLTEGFSLLQISVSSQTSPTCTKAADNICWLWDQIEKKNGKKVGCDRSNWAAEKRERKGKKMQSICNKFQGSSKFYHICFCLSDLIPWVSSWVSSCQQSLKGKFVFIAMTHETLLNSSWGGNHRLVRPKFLEWSNAWDASLGFLRQRNSQAQSLIS